ncbi:MAG: hypothetical protein ACTSUE_19240, partial [Promethearchaeota archaeon]
MEKVCDPNFDWATATSSVFGNVLPKFSNNACGWNGAWGRCVNETCMCEPGFRHDTTFLMMENCGYPVVMDGAIYVLVIIIIAMFLYAIYNTGLYDLPRVASQLWWPTQVKAPFRASYDSESNTAFKSRKVDARIFNVSMPLLFLSVVSLSIGVFLMLGESKSEIAYWWFMWVSSLGITFASSITLKTGITVGRNAKKFTKKSNRLYLFNTWRSEVYWYTVLITLPAFVIAIIVTHSINQKDFISIQSRHDIIVYVLILTVLACMFVFGYTLYHSSNILRDLRELQRANESMTRQR